MHRGSPTHSMLSLLFLLTFTSSCGQDRSVMTGAERLIEEGWESATGLPIGPLGVVTNHTGRLPDGTHLVDALLDAGLPVRAIFSPEHGFEGSAPEGARIYETGETYRGLPIHSLYGAETRPSEEQLVGLKTLVFDIQDVGARFYTYTSTMARTMEAAAEYGISYVVLDRPNPIGGVAVSGPRLDPDYASFVGLYPVPVRHGFTVGEYASYLRGESLIPGIEALDLRIVEMKRWRRAMYWEDTGVPWVAPSPNMRTPATAVVYPGACFVEGTNLSEGRGTERPFELIGAPWADGAAVAEDLNARGLEGVRFQQTVFTPGLPGSSVEVKWKGQTCSGIEIVVTDRQAFEPLTAGLSIVDAFRRNAPEEFRWRAAHFDRLAGVGWVREELEKGAPVEDIAAQWTDEVAAWRERVASYLIYR